MSANSPSPTISDHDELYAWIDSIPLSRPKKNIQRDFSDGVATAEVISHFLPKMIELHNYPAANSVAQKMYNWKTLNQKVLRKLDCKLTDEVIDGIVTTKPGYIETFLTDLRLKIDQTLTRRTHARALRTPSLVPPFPYSYPTLAAAAQDEYASAHPHHHPPYGEDRQSETMRLVHELQGTVEMLHVKTGRLEELLDLKERRIGELEMKLRVHGLNV
ncbi:Sperm flagellar protein 1 [Thoreauomyces humboldtii]|nr:Sperm flagellar protein 1 [Thoreauomyces humboldtii]